VTILFAMVDGFFGRKLDQVLAYSERSRHEIALANDALELQKRQLMMVSSAQERANRELTHANSDLKAFAYAVSHDLRSPLINIRGFSTELARELEALRPICDAGLAEMSAEDRQRATRALQHEIPEALHFIESSVERMDALISGILKLSRLGRRELKIEPVDLAAVVQSALADQAHRIQARGVVVEVESLPVVQTDELAISQIFSNLLANAVAYLDPQRPGRIQVFASDEAAGGVRFAVRDNGRGVAAGEETAIFELFRRVGPRTEQGEGMGLAYVDALVRRLGGRVWCESSAGVGSTFYFTLDASASV
jgi:signal transduction histidine kinase